MPGDGESARVADMLPCPEHGVGSFCLPEFLSSSQKCSEFFYHAYRNYCP